MSIISDETGEMNEHEMLMDSIVCLKYNVRDMLVLSKRLDPSISKEFNSLAGDIDSFLIDFYNAYQVKFDIDIMQYQYETKRLFDASLKDDLAYIKDNEDLKDAIDDCGRRIDMSMYSLSTSILIADLASEYNTILKGINNLSDAMIKAQKKLGI